MSNKVEIDTNLQTLILKPSKFDLSELFTQRNKIFVFH